MSCGFFLFFLVNCPPGTYSDSLTNTCKDCNVGFYQDEEGKPECQPCQKNHSTAVTGSKTSFDCQRKKIAWYILFMNIIYFVSY